MFEMNYAGGSIWMLKEPAGVTTNIIDRTATAASVTTLSNRVTLVESNLISVGFIAAAALQPADITGKLNITDGTATNNN